MCGLFQNDKSSRFHLPQNLIDTSLVLTLLTAGIWKSRKGHDESYTAVWVTQSWTVSTDGAQDGRKNMESGVGGPAGGWCGARGAVGHMHIWLQRGRREGHAQHAALAKALPHLRWYMMLTMYFSAPFLTPHPPKKDIPDKGVRAELAVSLRTVRLRSLFSLPHTLPVLCPLLDPNWAC